MNDASDNWLFAFNFAVPNLRSSTLNLNDSNQFFRPILCQISNFKFQKTTVVVAGSRYRVDGVGLGYGLEIRGNMVGFPPAKDISLRTLPVRMWSHPASNGCQGLFPWE